MTSRATATCNSLSDLLTIDRPDVLPSTSGVGANRRLPRALRARTAVHSFAVGRRLPLPEQPSPDVGTAIRTATGPDS